MNFASGFTSAFARADRAIGSLLESGGPGLILSIDIGDSLFDFIASNAATSDGFSFLRSPSLIRYRSRLCGLGPLPKPAAVIDEPVLFGRIDGHMRITDRNDPLESYGPQVSEVATRCIDSWAAGRPSLQFVHFGDPDLILDQIAGARETIARDRPIATLYPAHQSRAGLLSLLGSLGYEAFDLSCRRVSADRCDPATDFGWIAVPEEKHAAIAAVAIDPHSGEGDLRATPWKLVADRAALPRQRRSRAVFGLSASGALPQAKTIHAGDIVCITDCYPLETEGSHIWRWLGPRPRSRIAVPCPLPGVYRTELAVLACQVENGASDCRIIVEGREVKASTSASMPGTIEFVGHLDAANYAGYMEVDIVSMGQLVPAGNDPRTLRLSLQSITVSQWQ